MVFFLVVTVVFMAIVFFVVALFVLFIVSNYQLNFYSSTLPDIHAEDVFARAGLVGFDRSDGSRDEDDARDALHSRHAAWQTSPPTAEAHSSRQVSEAKVWIGLIGLPWLRVDFVCFYLHSRIFKRVFLSIRPYDHLIFRLYVPQFVSIKNGDLSLAAL